MRVFASSRYRKHRAMPTDWNYILASKTASVVFMSRNRLVGVIWLCSSRKNKTNKNKMNWELMLTYDTPAYMFNVNKNQPSRQTGSRNLTGQNTLPTKCDEISDFCHQYLLRKMQRKISIHGSQKRFPQYGIPIWNLWPNIRFLSSIFAENNATKNVHCHIC